MTEKMWKTAVLIALCWLSIVAVHELDEDERACVHETGVSEHLVREAKREHAVFGDNSKYKEFLSCCWKRYGYQDENGEINWEMVRSVIGRSYNPRVAIKIINKCMNVKGITGGDTAVLVLECLDDHAPNLHTVHHFYSGHKD
ncbi:uncharacterized protein LOC116180390 [Photinus pyralis]|uniref:Uncharacterized protein n=1 Tax=Photinus pyralis TaxID=7054 RepID=A0A1Y1K1B6_PHOPY|nr:uncharacterized protein LOC116180390 [Photinus pyralis]